MAHAQRNRNSSAARLVGQSHARTDEMTQMHRFGRLHSYHMDRKPDIDARMSRIDRFVSGPSYAMAEAQKQAQKK